ncbi:MAG: 50S ribosomal protein L11 methyltransferase [Deltaproteobacteria bacterium]
MKNPYDRLYIYYLKGCLPKENRSLGDAFIGNWEESGYTFLFFSSPSRQKVDTLLSAHPRLEFQDEYCMSYEDWQGGVVAPFRIGRIHVTPPWADDPSDSRDLPVSQACIQDGAIGIRLDPGVVFGTGMHPTTAHCIEALETLFTAHCPEKVLDLGTGTGLLAIAAVRLGCRRAMAVDLNLLAVRTARRNITLNGLENNILALQGRAENFVDLSSDLVISNIHYDVMKHLIESEGFLAKKFFILSGLLRNQATQIEDRLRHHPAAIIKKWDHEGIWHTYLGTTV